MRSRFILLFTSLLILICVAAASSLVTARLLTSPSVTTDYHDWVHKELGMTQEQEGRFFAAEQRYEERKRLLIESIRTANSRLAEAIDADRSYSLNVEAATRRVEERTGELRRATLEHLFEMREVLDPEQFDRLIHLTKEALESRSILH